MTGRRCTRCSAPEGRYLGRLADCVPEAGWVYCDHAGDLLAGVPVVDATPITLTAAGDELLCVLCVKNDERKAREKTAQDMALTIKCPRCRAPIGFKCRNYRKANKPTCKDRLPGKPAAKAAKREQDQPSLF